MHGLLHLSWWGYILAGLAMTQVTILAVTIYLHRCQSHRAVELHPIVSHFFRLWLWMSTGMVTKQWAAIHRKHHAKVETAEDPHSPQVKGVWTVLWSGTELYKKEAKNPETLERYGQGTPDDWMERNVYTKHSALGIMIMMGIDFLLFGPVGLSIWAVQMAWIPFFAAGVINGVAHYVGYRNFECQDASRNISPIGFFIGGEELHNNHHTYATSAKFSVKWWEFDMGWMVIRGLQMLGLAKPKRVPPKPVLQPGKTAVDADTLTAILTNRFQLMAQYSRNVMLPVLRKEIPNPTLYNRLKTLLVREPSLVDEVGHQALENLLINHEPLNRVYQFKLKLQNIWARSTATQKELVEALQDWCKQAEEAGIESLKKFVPYLKAYTPQAIKTA
jgi:stearoyl-CoA desaturase (delta-9 desaturase)